MKKLRKFHRKRFFSVFNLELVDILTDESFTLEEKKLAIKLIRFYDLEHSILLLLYGYASIIIKILYPSYILLLFLIVFVGFEIASTVFCILFKDADLTDNFCARLKK